MLLPRITRVSKVEIYLKGGGKITQNFREFTYTVTAESFTKMKWTTDGVMFAVVLDDVAAVVTGPFRRVIRFRH